MIVLGDGDYRCLGTFRINHLALYQLLEQTGEHAHWLLLLAAMIVHIEICVERMHVVRGSSESSMIDCSVESMKGGSPPYIHAAQASWPCT